jgi:chromosome segregation ATPase
MDWVRRVEQRLDELDRRTRLRHDHLLTALGALRKRIDKGFEEVHQALDEAHRALDEVHRALDEVRRGFAQIRLALLEQEMTLRKHLQEVEEDLGGLRSEMREALAQTVATLEDHEARLRKLEGAPPAA